MILRNFKAVNFRNLNNIEISPSSGINIISGENAHGKTNLLEGIWLFTGAKSFRGSKDRELIKFSEEKAILSSSFYSLEREQTAKIEIEERKKYFLNDIPIKSPLEMTENFNAIIFSPAHLSLIKDGPNFRRRFLDIAIGQLYPRYIEKLRNYTRALQQRNSVLKDAKYHSELYSFLDAFEEEIAKNGAFIIKYRLNYIEKLKKTVPFIYEGLSQKREALCLEYMSSVNCENEEIIYKELLKGLKERRKEDIFSGVTTIGPHRDDMLFTLNGLDARSFGSQGQQRSVTIALKLGEAEILKEISGEQPIALLDDVMSELDQQRQDYIMNHISDWQVFITLCDPDNIKRLKTGNVYRMENGEISRIL